MSKPLHLYLLSGTLESEDQLQVSAVTSVSRARGRVPFHAYCYLPFTQTLFSRDLWPSTFANVSRTGVTAVTYSLVMSSWSSVKDGTFLTVSLVGSVNFHWRDGIMSGNGILLRRLMDFFYRFIFLYHPVEFEVALLACHLLSGVQVCFPLFEKNCTRLSELKFCVWECASLNRLGQF
jgi:hypothetical protein